MAYSFIQSSSQYLWVSSSPISDIPITLCAWIYVATNNATLRHILSVGDENNNRSSILINQSNQPVTFRSINNTNNGTPTSTTVPTGVWCHHCGVISSASFRATYFNGTLVGSNSTNTPGSANYTNIGIGSRASTPQNYMNGFIAEASIWNVALGANEINSLAKGFASYFIRPQSLVFYAPLVRELTEVRTGLTLTNNNSATVTSHPRIYY